MTASYVKSFSDSLFSFYVYYSSLLLGWQITSFIYLYQSTVTEEISNRLLKWIVFEPYVIGIGAFITMVILIFFKISAHNHSKKILDLQKQIKIQSFFLVILFFNYLAIIYNIHLDVFELFTFVFAIWILTKWGSVFYNTKRAGWRHPTTHGTFFVSAILIGCSLLSIFNLIPIDNSFTQSLLLFFLIFDLFIVYARFQYLSKSGEATIQIARKLMGPQILYFGSRIILGIFMPAIFILYMMLLKESDIRGVEVLILVGTFLDRSLFVTSVDLTD